jgi:P4 family phage/plasmid primase-like protien
LGKRAYDPIVLYDQINDLTSIYCVGEEKILWYYDKSENMWYNEGEMFILRELKDRYPELNNTEFREVIFEFESNNQLKENQFQKKLEKSFHYLQFGKHKLLSLEDFKLVENDPKYFVHNRIDVELNFKAAPPKLFLQCLKNALPDPRDQFLLLQAFACILLVRTTDIDKIFLFMGTGQNGKSTILHVITKLFWNYTSAVSLHDIANDRFALADLFGMLVNVHADITGFKVNDASTIKTITSGDPISIQEKYGKRHRANIKVIQFYSANRVPEFDDHTEGLMRRMIPIEFNQKITITDRNIKEKLEQEQEEILNMLYRVAVFTKKNGFISKPTTEEVKAILEEKGNSALQFLNETSGYVRHSNDLDEKGKIKHMITKNLMYTLYARFCHAHAYTPKSKRGFGMQLEARGIEEARTSKERYWLGYYPNEDMVKKTQAEKLKPKEQKDLTTFES